MAILQSKYFQLYCLLRGHWLMMAGRPVHAKMNKKKDYQCRMKMRQIHCLLFILYQKSRY